MDLGIAGRRALVVASSAGLGFGTAAALTEAGCRVAISGRTRARLDAAVRALPGSVGVVGDVGTTDGALATVTAAVDALGGPVDILVPNAGGPPAGSATEVSLEAYAPALAANLLSVVAMCAEVVPGMRERRWGRIVAITSSTVRQPSQQLVLSNTARAGVTAYLKTLSGAVAADGVTVNSVQPGLHATDRLRELYGEALDHLGESVPVGFVGDARDFGAAVAFLCSEPARYITGVALPVDGGAFQGLQ